MTPRVLSTCEAMLVLIGILAHFSSHAYGQAESRTISGSVTDPRGAVVPEATVRLIDVDHGTFYEP